MNTHNDIILPYNNGYGFYYIAVIVVLYCIMLFSTIQLV